MAWTADTAVAAGREQVMDVLTRPCSIASWAPVPFEVEGLKGDRLETGSRARVAGRLAGKELAFDVDVRKASEGQLRLIAHGPYLELIVSYDVEELENSAYVNATIEVNGKGVLGRFVARAVDGLMAGGALSMALRQLAAAAEQSDFATTPEFAIAA